MILAFGNKARHGKDTAAQAIVKAFNAVQVNFADALKREVNYAISDTGSVETLLKHGYGDIFNFPAWVVPEESPSFADPLCPLGKHPKLLQWWGTEYRRAQDPLYWVKKWKEQVEYAENYVGDMVFVTADARFLNEVKAVKEVGGYTCRVVRLDESGDLYTSTDRDNSHVSETELDFYNWDFEITAKTGHAELIGRQAVTLVQYLDGMRYDTH